MVFRLAPRFTQHPQGNRKLHEKLSDEIADAVQGAEEHQVWNTYPVDKINDKEIPLSDLKVLIVDDEEMTLGALSNWLQDAGLNEKNIDTFRTVDDALSKFHKSAYDLLLVDHEMVGETGSMLLDQLARYAQDKTSFLYPTVVATSLYGEEVYAHEKNYGKDYPYCHYSDLFEFKTSADTFKHIGESGNSITEALAKNKCRLLPPK